MTPAMRRIERLLVRAAGDPKPKVPEAGRLLWTCFGQLSAARQYGQHGPQPIAFTEIEAWARVSRTPLRPDHVEILRRMDDAWLAASFERQKSGERPSADGVKILPRSSGHAISPGLFDAVF